MDKDNVGADGVQSGSNGDSSMTSGPSLAGPVNSTTDGAAELEIPHGRLGSSVDVPPVSRSVAQLNSQVTNQPDIQHMDRFSNVAARAATVNSAFDVVHGSFADIPVESQVEPISGARINSDPSLAANQTSGVNSVPRPQPSNGNLVGQNFMSNGSVGRPVDSGDSPQQQIHSSVQSFRSTVNPSLTQQINMQSPTQPVLAGAGDIVLSGASHKKNHKRLAIGLVLLFALVVVVGGGIITYSALFSQDASQQQEARNYREAFNQYANYILYNKDAMDNISEKSNNVANYAVWDAVNDGNMGFLDKAKDLFDNFMKQDKEDLNETTIVLLQRYVNVFDFYYLYNTTIRPSYATILEQYVQSGKDVATAYINNSYKVFESSSELANMYGENQKEVDLSILAQIDIAALSGCLKGGEMDQACMNSFGSDFSERRSRLIRIVQSVKFDANNEIVNDCFALADEIYKLEEE